MTPPQDDSKRPGVARAPADSEPVGLSTVPRRRIVVGGDPKAGSSNPPAEQGESAPAPPPASSRDKGREKRSSAPAHLKGRRERLPGTGYSEVPVHGEDRVAPSAIPRAPRMPQIDGEKATSPEAAGRTTVGVLGPAIRRAAEELLEARSAERSSQPAEFRRSDTARSV